MKILGLLLLLSGWGIVLAAVALLAPGTTRLAFFLSGMGVEAIGLFLCGRSHPLSRDVLSRDGKE